MIRLSHWYNINRDYIKLFLLLWINLKFPKHKNVKDKDSYCKIPQQKSYIVDKQNCK